MKKLITALLNETVNNKLREYNEINVLMKDIQYQEGIIEALEMNKEMEYIILSELMPGELNVKELIEREASEQVSFMNSKINNSKKDISYIDGANHSYDGKEEELASQICNFLKYCAKMD